MYNTLPKHSRSSRIACPARSAAQIGVAVCALLVLASCTSESATAPTQETNGALTVRTVSADGFALETTDRPNASAAAVACIRSEADLRQAAQVGGGYTFCAPGTTIIIRQATRVLVSANFGLNASGAVNSTIRGNGVSGVFGVSRGVELLLNNVTVRGGKTRVGGGVTVLGGTLTLRGRSSITANAAAAGAGVAILSGTLRMFNTSTIARDTASGYFDAAAHTYYVPIGGGVYLEGSTLSMTDSSSVSDNRALDRNMVTPGLGFVGAFGGGGIWASGSNIQLNQRAEISRNAVNLKLRGGGILFDALGPSTLTLGTSARITQNVADQLNGGTGGGLLVFDFYGNDLTLNGVSPATLFGNTGANYCTVRTCLF
jgi:hypothetical protein